MSKGRRGRCYYSTILLLLLGSTTAYAFELTIISPDLVLPAVPFVPFFPVILADYIKRPTPSWYLNTRKQPVAADDDDNNKALLVCLGDSLTHGSISSNWVEKVSGRLTSTHVVLNAGINSETSAAVRARLGEVILSCNSNSSNNKSSAVVILVGTNDLIGALDSAAAQMYKLKLPAQRNIPPSLDTYANELKEIVLELYEKLGENVRIAVMSPPPLGECANGIAWETGATMANICHEICCELPSNKVEYLPLFENVRDEMLRVVGDNGKEFSFTDAVPLTSVTVPWQRLILRWPYSSIRRANGFQYTIDSVHFAEEFGILVEKMVCNWLQEEEAYEFQGAVLH